jgi:hypothetical protein
LFLVANRNKLFENFDQIISKNTVWYPFDWLAKNNDLNHFNLNHLIA